MKKKEEPQTKKENKGEKTSTLVELKKRYHTLIKKNIQEDEDRKVDNETMSLVFDAQIN